MDKITLFKNSIIDILEDNAIYFRGTTNPLEVKTVFDEKANIYQLLMNGWLDDDYIFQCLFHLEIKNEKIWIQWNDTDFPIEEALIKRGISNNDIVLGLKHPKARKYTEFAEA